ncbi:hypothetical protein L6452_19586 [Arctium lappa]|uniref:Uncharacterized protein n=1 Tax=Arctium lappa TaxID=4217 RepID=A0ACB9B9W7_ARCLA|nr:hypothetical protein L6452_19586 [Arctium lappa]
MPKVLVQLSLALLSKQRRGALDDEINHNKKGRLTLTLCRPPMVPLLWKSEAERSKNLGEKHKTYHCVVVAVVLDSTKIDSKSDIESTTKCPQTTRLVSLHDPASDFRVRAYFSGNSAIGCCREKGKDDGKGVEVGKEEEVQVLESICGCMV